MSEEPPDLVPWEPIADWLARREADDEGPFAGMVVESKLSKRDRYAPEAKIIAYEIMAHNAEREDSENE